MVPPGLHGPRNAIRPCTVDRIEAYGSVAKEGGGVRQERPRAANERIIAQGTEFSEVSGKARMIQSHQNRSLVRMRRHDCSRQTDACALPGRNARRSHRDIATRHVRRHVFDKRLPCDSATEATTEIVHLVVPRAPDGGYRHVREVLEQQAGKTRERPDRRAAAQEQMDPVWRTRDAARAMRSGKRWSEQRETRTEQERTVGGYAACILVGKASESLVKEQIAIMGSVIQILDHKHSRSGTPKNSLPGRPQPIVVQHNPVGSWLEHRKRGLCVALPGGSHGGTQAPLCVTGRWRDHAFGVRSKHEGAGRPATLQCARESKTPAEMPPAYGGSHVRAKCNLESAQLRNAFCWTPAFKPIRSGRRRSNAMTSSVEIRCPGRCSSLKIAASNSQSS